MLESVHAAWAYVSDNGLLSSLIAGLFVTAVTEWLRSRFKTEKTSEPGSEQGGLGYLWAGFWEKRLILGLLLGIIAALITYWLWPSSPDRETTPKPCKEVRTLAPESPTQQTSTNLNYGAFIETSLAADGGTQVFQFAGSRHDVIQIAVTTDKDESLDSLEFSFQPTAESVSPKDLENGWSHRRTLMASNLYTMQLKNTGRVAKELYLRLVPLNVKAEYELEKGVSVHGQLDQFGDADVFTFSANSEERLLLGIDVGEDLYNDAVRVNLDLQPPDGALQSVARIQNRLRREISAVDEGTFYLVLSQEQGHKVDYELCLSELSEPNDLGTISADPVVERGSIAFAGASDIFHFEASAGEVLKVKVDPRQGELEPVVYLFGPSSPMAKAAESTEFEYSVEVAGQHQIKVQAARGSSGLGDYVLQVSKIGAFPEP